MNKLSIRPYQSAWLAAVADGLSKGVTRQLGRAATGLGKTVFFANLPGKLNLSKRMLILVHREELATQAADKIRLWNPGRTVGVEMGASTSSSSDQIVVAGVQTIGRANNRRLQEFKPEEFSVLVCDECFPAGTLVDGKPIESYNLGDCVRAFDPTKKQQSTKRITRLFKNPTPAQMVTVNVGGKKITCTLDHPFWVTVKEKSGTYSLWMPARLIEKGDYVLADESHTKLRGVFVAYAERFKIAKNKIQSRLERLLWGGVFESPERSNDGKHESATCLRENDKEQPDASTCCKTEDAGEFEENTTQATRQGWERYRPNDLGSLVSDQTWDGIKRGGSYEDEARQRVSYLLQTGPRGQYDSSGRRGRWKLPLSSFEAGTRPKEGGVLRLSRVDGIEVHERGSDGTFGGLCPDGFVYNLEVEDFHTYFANGCLVHNCHHASATSYDNVFEHFGSKTRTDLLTLGVTATPSRGDGKGLEIFQEITFDMPLEKGIREGWLSELRGIRVKTKVSLDDVHTVAGEYNQGELERTINVEARNEQIVQAWLENCEDRQTIAFVRSIKHAQDLANAFKMCGVAAQAVWGDDPYRKEKLSAYRARQLRMLVNAQLLTEGYDNWSTSCIIEAAPTKSAGRYEQEIGRGTRIPEGINNLHEARKLGLRIDKQDCIVLDVVDNSQRHSLNNIATLFGLNEDLDLKGTKITTVLDKLEEAEQKNPNADLTKLTDFTKLDTYIEQVDLFKVEYPPEIIQISDYQWHRTRKGSYVLLLADGESVVVLQDLLERWNMHGTVNGKQFTRTASDFNNAIREADTMVKILGGRSVETLAKRNAKWHAEAPKPGQLALCKQLRLVVPEGATRGQVSARINKRLQELKENRKVA